MTEPPIRSADNVVQLPVKPANSRVTDDASAVAGIAALAAAGSPDDPRMQEVMRLAGAFLAIEDAQARAALIALAERLVSYDWALRVREG